MCICPDIKIAGRTKGELLTNEVEMLEVNKSTNTLFCVDTLHYQYLMFYFELMCKPQVTCSLYFMIHFFGGL